MLQLFLSLLAFIMTSTHSNKRFIDLSHKLSKVLRHEAKSLGLEISSAGFVKLDELLRQKQFSKYTIDDIRIVVDTNDKKRFELIDGDDDGSPQIRAVQGHSISSIDTEELLSPILTPHELPLCIHGTFRQAMDDILATGLSRMRRNHIHFAVGLDVTSGIRKSAEIFIFIDVEKAMEAGIRFYRSNNGVILSPGNEHGFISTEYFMKIVDKDD